MLTSLRPAFICRAHVLSRSISSTPSQKNNNGKPENFRQGRPPLGDLVTEILDSIPSEVNENIVTRRKTKKWRVFNNGDIVTPKELTPAKCANVYRKPRFPRTPPPAPVARYNDMFRQLSMDPLDFSLNPSVLSNYISEMGKIYSRNVTGLTSRSQRRLGKAIRRARMIGVLPQLSRPSAGWLASHMKRSNS